MLKKFFSIAAVAMLFAACEIVEVEVEPVIGQGSGVYTIGATFEDSLTKSDVNDKGEFTWSGADSAPKDEIWVYSDTKLWNPFVRNNGQSDSKTCQFSCFAFQGNYMNKAAVFPKIERYDSNWDLLYSNEPVFDGETLSINLPGEIQWENASTNNYTSSSGFLCDYLTMQADNVMVAFFNYGSNYIDNLQFYNAGGLFRLMLNNVPAGAASLEFYSVDNKRISGRFQVATSGTNSVIPTINTTAIAAAATGEELNENKVTINFDAVNNTTNRVFFIPVPVGEYRIGLDIKDAYGNSLWTYTSTKKNSVTRGMMKKMPVLTCNVQTGGSGEGTKSNTRVTPKSPSEAVNVSLPNTEDDVFVRMNKTTGAINIAYSTEANAAHPANVYLTALDDIAELNINLPDSHVELSGDGNKMETIDQINANTAVNTLVVFGNVQIGKSGTNDGLKVTGGSLELNAPVAGKVTVVYDVVEETVNKTSDKVSININSHINDLEVTSASTQSAPDKIYVTLGSDSKVNETLIVPEVNCNLYIAPGAQAKTVETSASENSIAGAVENLSAEGDGTSVVVEKEGSVTNTLSSSDKATVVIVERTEQEVQAEQAGAITATITTSTQGTVDTVASDAVAMIDGESYPTLAAAFENVADGQTIKLIADVTLDDKLVVALAGKAITLDLGGKTLTGRTNLTSGSLTIQNGNVVYNDGQPLNVYGSATVGAQNYSVLTVARDVTVTGKYGVCVFGPTASSHPGYGAVVNVEGKLIANNGVFVSGNLGIDIAADMNNIVNISGTLTSQNDVAIALNGWATVNVQSGAKITGNTGIAVKRGVLNVYEGATVTANGAWVTPPAANNDGTEPTGAAVSMTNTYNKYGSMAVNIAGGSFTSANGQALYKADQTYTNAATFTATGGTFSSNPSEFVPAGLTAVMNGNVWSIENSAYKASIGSNLYVTLDAAIEAAQAGETITILDNIDCDHGFTLDKSLAIDLNGKTISFTGVVGIGRKYHPDGFTQSRAFKITGSADFTLKNGTVSLNEALLGSVRFDSTGNLLLENYTTNNSRGWGLNIKLEKGTAVLKNVTIDAQIGGGVEVNGPATATMTDCVIRQTGVDTESWISAAVSVAYGGHLTVNSGSYSALYASYIYTSGGTLDILGGTFTGRRTDSKGAAVMIQKDNANYPEPNAIVNIAKGVFTGRLEADNPNCALTISGGTFNTGDGNNKLIDIKPQACASISGGTFDEDPSAYVIDGYEATHPSSNIWKVGQVTGVAAIGSTGYSSLAEAIEAAANGQTIKILKNFTIEGNAGVTIPAGKSITIDLNGNNIKNRVTEDAQSQLIVNRGTLTITDSSAGANGTMTNEIASGVHTGAWTNYNYYTNIISNFGTLTINAGNLTQVATTNISYVIDNLGANSSVTINGGSLTAGYIPIRAYNATNSVTIHGGSLSGLFDLYLQLTTTLVIDGGTFSAPTRSIIYVDAASNISISGNPVFTNGTERKFIAFDADAVMDASTLSVTGGTYNTDPSDYVSAGYGAFQSGNVWTVQQLTASNAAAQIGSTLYATLPAAFAAATASQTITLLADLDFSQAPYNVYKWGDTVNPLAISVDNVTFDLNGHTISNMGNCALGIGSIFAKDGTVSGVTIMNGTLNAGTTDNVVNSYVLLLGGAKNATIQNVTTNGGINACAESDVLIKDCVVNGTKYYTVCAQTGANVTISGTTYTKNTDQTVKTKAMFWVQNAGTDPDMITSSNSTGAFAASVIALQSGNFTLDPNGSFYLGGGLAPVISGGTYNFDPSAYCAAGYEATEDNGTWTVQHIPYVAMIGSQGYESLAAAVAAAQSGATIELVADDNVSLTGGAEIEINKPLTITGATDSNGEPLYTVFGKADCVVDFNDIFLTSTSGTINISNIRLSNFGDETTASKNGRAPLFVSSNNNNAVIENVYISDINTEAVHINGGSFLIKDCAFDCANLNGDDIFTRGIQVTNHAYGTIRNTAISNTIGSIKKNVTTAPIELIGDGNVLIQDCELSSLDESDVKSYGIAVGPCADQPGGSQVTVRKCTVSAYVALYGDGDTNAQVTVESGEFVGALLQGDNGSGLVITGGTFFVDPSAYVAAGYGVTRSDSDYVVAPVNTTWDGSSKAALTDLDNNTYGIYSAAQLAQLAYDVNNGTSYAGKTVKLMNNIDLNNKAWTPIGNNGSWNTAGTGFAGTFDGNCKTVSNLAVSELHGTPSFAGFFGIINPAKSATVTIQNLTIDHFSVASNHQAGAILAHSGVDAGVGKVVITGCIVSNGTLTSTPTQLQPSGYDDANQVGAIAGALYNGAHEITSNSVSSVTITGFRDLGGLVGFMTGSVLSNNTITGATITQVDAGYTVAEWKKTQTVNEYVGRRSNDESTCNTAWTLGEGNSFSGSINRLL